MSPSEAHPEPRPHSPLDRGICNSINFFNLDGGASQVQLAVVTLGIFVIAFDRGQESVSALAIVTAGATLGFLIWNKQPAKIYMGDAGALFLGVVISVLTIRVNPGIQPSWKSLALMPILLAVPILDTTVAVSTSSSIYRGLTPLHTAVKDHLSHRFGTLKGLTTKPRLAFLLWAGSGLICSTGHWVIYYSPARFGTPTNLFIGAHRAWCWFYFLQNPHED